MYSRHWKKPNQIFAVFTNTTGKIRLKSGESPASIVSIQTINTLFEPSTSASSNFTIDWNAVDGIYEININDNVVITTGAYGTYPNNIAGNGYIITLNSSDNDTTAPTGTISINANATYTNSIDVSLSLSATDTIGVTGYYLSGSNITPSAIDTGWNAVTSSVSYLATIPYTLSTGDGTKALYCWYKDAAGNVSSSNTDSIALDTTLPAVTITSPTSGTGYATTSSSITLGGSASDADSGIASINWSNNRGGSGSATGTTAWSAPGITLYNNGANGINVITVTATDNAGNSSTDTLTVTYTIPTPGTIALSGATYSVVENTPTVTINVTRTGGSS
ncbi:MAG: hypothetical protein AABZ27_07490, partial [Candidatus Omnitrophota bacterium]